MGKTSLRVKVKEGKITELNNIFGFREKNFLL